MIPKTIHQIWIGGDMPDIIELYTSAWKKCRGWEYRLWGNEDLTKENFPLTWFLIKKILSKDKITYASIADLMRLEILYWNGGVYLDTTFEKKKSLNTLFKNSDTFCISNEVDYKVEDYVSNSFIASVPKHSILKRLLSKRFLKRIDLTDNANVATGPYFVKKGITKKDKYRMIPTRLIYPVDIEKYYTGEDRLEEHKDPDKCVSTFQREIKRKDKKDKYKEYTYFGKKIYVKYPCTSYSYSYMIKHWDIGGTWI